MVIDSGGKRIEIGTPEHVRSVLVQCFGNRTQAARRLGFQSATHFRRFLARHKSYDKACDPESIRDEINELWRDIGESCLAKAAAEGNVRAIFKILDDKCSSNGWGSHDRATRSASSPAQTQTERGHDLVSLFRRPPTPISGGSDDA